MPKRPANNLIKPMILDGIRTEKELTKIITAIVDELIKEENHLRADLEESDYAALEDSISKYAWQAELKIQLRQVKKTKAMILAILKRSTNRLVLATIEIGERIN